MKTISASTHQSLKLKSTASRKLGPVLSASMRNVMALTWAGVAALLLVALSVWAVGMDINTYLGASSWGLGFVFLALALDNDRKHARYQLMTGVALLTSALLQGILSPGFMMITAAILAVWLSGVVFRRLSV